MFANNAKETMEIVLGISALFLITASLVADYKWRQWMAARRREEQTIE